MTDPVTAQQEWENAYDEAMQWRDWLTCEILIDERETANWWLEQKADRTLSAAVVSRVSAYTGTQP